MKHNIFYLLYLSAVLSFMCYLDNINVNQHVKELLYLRLKSLRENLFHHVVQETLLSPNVAISNFP